MWIKDELQEARYYRQLAKQQGKSINNIAHTLYDHLLALYVLYKVDKSAAQGYATQMSKNIQFDGFRQSMPDLFNILTLIIQQEKYADRLFNNWSVTLPEMRIKRIIRDMARGDLNAGDMDQLLMILQRQFKSILDGDQMRIRRLATSWDKNNSSQNSFAVTRLIQTMRRPINTDLYELFRTKTKKLFKSDK